MERDRIDSAKVKITVVKLSTQSLTLIVPSELQEEFKRMVNRAMNCWPDASPAMKEFADRITNDRVMQDYYAQDSARHKK